MVQVINSRIALILFFFWVVFFLPNLVCDDYMTHGKWTAFLSILGIYLYFSVVFYKRSLHYPTGLSILRRGCLARKLHTSRIELATYSMSHNPI